MANKLSLEEFREIKEKLVDESLKGKDKYEIQDKLLSYDLSDIPFEEWKGIYVSSSKDHIADFSKTHANIDFKYINFFANVNFKGCNLRNINIDRTIKPEYFDEKTIKENEDLFLSDIFSPEFKEKYYSCTLAMNDLFTLTKEQINELSRKQYKEHFKYLEHNPEMIYYMDLDKIVDIHNNHKDLYEALDTILDPKYFNKFWHTNGKIISYPEMVSKLKGKSIEEIKSICFSYLKESIIKNKFPRINLDDYPKLFIDENKDLFLIDVNIPLEIKKKYYEKELEIDDVINYYDVFKNIPIDSFLIDSDHLIFIINKYGIGEYQKAVKKYPDLFIYLKRIQRLQRFSNYLTDSSISLEENLLLAAKEFFKNMYRDQKELWRINEKTRELEFYPPKYLKSFNFKYIKELKTIKDLMKYNNHTFILDNNEQRNVINTLGIDNIKMLQKDLKYFSYCKETNMGEGYYLELFDPIVDLFVSINENFLYENGIDFKHGTLPYEEFLDEFAKLLDLMRRRGEFVYFPDYRFIKGKFRKKYSNIFIDEKAPQELINSFYRDEITPSFLSEHKEYIPYLINRDISNVVYIPIKIKLKTEDLNFLVEYTKRFGNEKFLNLISKYGIILEKIYYVNMKEKDLETEECYEKALKKAMYEAIVKNRFDYKYLKKVKDFVNTYPELFIEVKDIEGLSDEEKENLEEGFYDGCISFWDIKNHPELVDVLKDKNFSICFKNILDKGYQKPKNYIMCLYKEVLNTYGKENFFKLALKYGSYFDMVDYNITTQVYFNNDKCYNMNDKELDFNGFCKIVEKEIFLDIQKGLHYNPDVSPEFLKKEHPELFLSEDAPEELKTIFYRTCLNFNALSENQDWLPYLKGIDLRPALIRNVREKDSLDKYFELFGYDLAIKLGIKKPETVTYMIYDNKVDLMKKWYDKTGCKFIPDYVVMENIPIEEADKFLSNGTLWSILMKMDRFAFHYETRDAMFKLAYSFGVFDGDMRGFKKVLELLKEPPKKISINYNKAFNDINKDIESPGHRYYFKEKFDGDEFFDAIIDYLDYNSPTNVVYSEYLAELYKAIKEEKIDMQKPLGLLDHFYKTKDGDDYYSLILDKQKYPKTCYALKEMFDGIRIPIDNLPVVKPFVAHQLFSGFKIEYNPEFREFLLDNLDKILSNNEYITYISNIQKQFKDIKRANINRKLTLDLAVSYVQQNKYRDIHIGNERVAEVSAIAGYSQEDFDKLQRIYNYGKQRVFSSIPRVEDKIDKYSYEMLRLDDPLAMAVGTLTDCCQELGNVAEMCMEHSMVDKNGRVFVVRDNKGNIVSQSWVWRNKNVLCFDNIEIPNKAFDRVENRAEFAIEVYKIYEKAAHELIEKDEEVYKKLLEENKITEEQYKYLKLNKVTVGIGYNDIKEAIRKLAKVDSNTAHPLKFKPPINLGRNLYTSDSTTQYIIEEKDSNLPISNNTTTLPIHFDSYIIYDKSNFKMSDLIKLSKLNEYLEYDYEKSDAIGELAKYYNLDKEKTKVIMNSNFAIVYEEKYDIINIVDLLYNTKVEDMDIEDVVIMQLRLALDQIRGNKTIDISNLEKDEKAIYNKAINLKEEIDHERGLKV